VGLRGLAAAGAGIEADGSATDKPDFDRHSRGSRRQILATDSCQLGCRLTIFAGQFAALCPEGPFPQALSGRNPFSNIRNGSTIGKFPMLRPAAGSPHRHDEEQKRQNFPSEKATSKSHFPLSRPASALSPKSKKI
jgi:hypothetical protein